MKPHPIRGIYKLSFIVLLLTFADSIFSQTNLSYPRKKVSFIYSGKSLGALGNIRFQKEHELLTEMAIRDSIGFELVSHACWRSKGVTIFMPSREPAENELELILVNRPQWEDLGNIEAIRSDHVLLFQDPNRGKQDMLEMIRAHPGVKEDYPDFRSARVRIFRTEILKKTEALIVVEQNPIWPSSIEHWKIGEVNRVDFGKTSRLFELPYNFGAIESRSTVIQKLRSESNTDTTILVDMGHRNGDFNISQIERAIVDFAGLDYLDYQLVVPYEFELSMGGNSLKNLLELYPSLEFIATNIDTDIPDLTKKHKIVKIDSTKIGILGLVDPLLKVNLAGSVLKNIKLLDPFTAAINEIKKLNRAGVNLIVAFTNMSPSDNARLSEQVKGIHIIIADWYSQGIPYEDQINMEINNGGANRFFRPYLKAHNYDYGIAVGQLDLTLVPGRNEELYLANIRHQLHPVNDQIPGDTSLTGYLDDKIPANKIPKGDLYFPDFADVLAINPKLQNIDDVTRQGRVSKNLWEKFLARIIRENGPAEVSVIRPLPSFLPQIGKLHEREVRSWLWTEDEILHCDLKGRDLLRLLGSGEGRKLITNGIVGGKVLGRSVLPNAYYRVATTNVIYNGIFKPFFRNAVRVDTKFLIRPNGTLENNKFQGSSIKLRDYILHELKRIRSQGKGKTYHAKIAELLSPEAPFERLFSFNFFKPSLWSTLSRSYKGTGYESVPESRIGADNSFVLGINGKFIMTYDAPKAAWDLGVKFGFAKQSAEKNGGEKQISESLDDILINLTHRFKGKRNFKFQPLARMEYDSEFTATVNKKTGNKNQKQRTLRAVVGINKKPTAKWPRRELAFTAENDFASKHDQYGFQYHSRGRFPLDLGWKVIYNLTHNINYHLPSKDDTARELSFKINSIHELQIPLFGDISMTFTADFFIFRGKLDINKRPGLSMLYRVGLTYDRLWKPKYQPLL